MSKKYRVKSPDGRTFEVNAPDDATPQQVMAYAQQHFQTQAASATLSPSLSPAQAVSAAAVPDLGVMDPIRSGEITDLPSAGQYMKAHGIAMGSPEYTRILNELHDQRVKSETPQAVAGAQAFVHNFAKPFIGGAQTAVNLLAPDSPAATSFNQQIADNERNYQGVTPDGIGTDIGAVTGTVAPYLIGGAALKSAGLVPEVSTLGQKMLASGLAGAATGAIQPVTDGGSFEANKVEQILRNGAEGVAFPLAGAALRRVGGAARNVNRLFTDAGRQQLAEARVAKLLGKASPYDTQATINKLTGAPAPLPGATLNAGQALGGPRGIQAAQAFTKDPNASVIMHEARNANNAARADAVKRMAGTDADLEAAKQARAEKVQPYIDAHLTPQTPLSRWTAAATPFDNLLNGNVRMSGADHDAIMAARNVVAKVRGGSLQEDDGMQALQELEEGVTSKAAQNAFLKAYGAVDNNMVDPSHLLSFIAKMRNTGPGARVGVRGALDSIAKTIRESQNARGLVPLDVLDSVRQNLTNHIVSPAGKHASAQEVKLLAPVRYQIVKTVGQRAPGYSDYLAAYAKASTPINTMEGLRSLIADNALLGVDTSGSPVLEARNIRRFLNKDVLKRYGISDDAIKKLEAIRDSAQADELLNKNVGPKGRLPSLNGPLMLRPSVPRLVGSVAGSYLGHALGLPGGYALGIIPGEMVGETLARPLANANADILERAARIFNSPTASAHALKVANQVPDVSNSFLARAQRAMQPYRIKPQPKLFGP